LAQVELQAQQIQLQVVLEDHQLLITLSLMAVVVVLVILVEMQQLMVHLAAEGQSAQLLTISREQLEGFKAMLAVTWVELEQHGEQVLEVVVLEVLVEVFPLQVVNRVVEGA
jgi:hypothetical protein